MNNQKYPLKYVQQIDISLKAQRHAPRDAWVMYNSVMQSMFGNIWKHSAAICYIDQGVNTQKHAHISRCLRYCSQFEVEHLIKSLAL